MGWFEISILSRGAWTSNYRRELRYSQKKKNKNKIPKLLSSFGATYNFLYSKHFSWPKYEKKNFQKIFFQILFRFSSQNTKKSQKRTLQFHENTTFQIFSDIIFAQYFKKVQDFQMLFPDLGVSIGPIIEAIANHSGELEHQTFFSIENSGISKYWSLYLAK